VVADVTGGTQSWQNINHTPGKHQKVDTVCTVVVFIFSCSVWVCVCVGFVMCVLVFTVCCIVCTVFLYCLVYVYVFLLVLSVLPPSDNSIAVNNNTNNYSTSRGTLYHHKHRLTCCLPPLEHFDRLFESYCGHGWISALFRAWSLCMLWRKFGG
jgi:hypothetical protein